MAIDNPLSDPESKFQQTLIKIDYALTAFFTLEALIKIIAFGLIFCGSTSYLRNAWNVLDLFVVVITVSIYDCLNIFIAIIIHTELIKSESH